MTKKDLTNREVFISILKIILIYTIFAGANFVAIKIYWWLGLACFCIFVAFALTIIFAYALAFIPSFLIWISVKRSISKGQFSNNSEKAEAISGKLLFNLVAPIGLLIFFLLALISVLLFSLF